AAGRTRTAAGRWPSCAGKGCSLTTAAVTAEKKASRQTPLSPGPWKILSLDSESLMRVRVRHEVVAVAVMHSPGDITHGTQRASQEHSCSLPQPRTCWGQ